MFRLAQNSRRCASQLVDLLAASDLEKKTDFEDKKRLKNF